MIIYEAEGVKFPNIMKRETTAWIRKVAASYGKKVGEIGYLFVNDDKIQPSEVHTMTLLHISKVATEVESIQATYPSPTAVA